MKRPALIRPPPIWDIFNLYKILTRDVIDFYVQTAEVG